MSPLMGSSYYDSTRVSAEQAQSWDTLLEAAQAAGSKVGRRCRRRSGWRCRRRRWPGSRDGRRCSAWYAGKTIADIQSANSAATVATATRNDTLYAFPMGGGNNYFLYYASTAA